MKKYFVQFVLLVTGERLGFQIEAPNEHSALFVVMSLGGEKSNIECVEIKDFQDNLPTVQYQGKWKSVATAIR